jgi:hypothetical protein
VAAGEYQLDLPDTWGGCLDEYADCVNPPGLKDISVTLSVPAGWVAMFDGTLLARQTSSAVHPVFVMIHPAGYLYEDPCREMDHGIPTIEVDPTSAASFVNALRDHPLLDTTKPKDVTLGGFNGKYIELTAPQDLSDCEVFRPWDPGLYAQAPGQRWRLWALEINGARMVVHGHVFPDTPAAEVEEMKALIDSIQFIVTTDAGS